MEKAKPLVIFHGNCNDGFAAAWVIWREHPDWEYQIGRYGEAPPDVAGREVVMVDFSYKRKVIEEMARSASSITIIDHHKSAVEELTPVPFGEDLCDVQVMIDQSRCGAMLTWIHLNGTAPPPDLMHYIEDRDLWRRALPMTQEVTMAVWSYPKDFDVWSWLMTRPVQDLMDEGKHIRRYYDLEVARLIEHWHEAPTFSEIGTMTVPCINVLKAYASDVGHALGQGQPFAACFYFNGSGWEYSLRSEAGALNVAAIAETYGGGGHEHAAGFKVREPLPMLDYEAAKGFPPDPPLVSHNVG